MYSATTSSRFTNVNNEYSAESSNVSELFPNLLLYFLIDSNWQIVSFFSSYPYDKGVLQKKKPNNSALSNVMTGSNLAAALRWAELLWEPSLFSKTGGEVMVCSHLE